MTFLITDNNFVVAISLQIELYPSSKEGYVGLYIRILSLPSNPYSLLFHNPLNYTRGYLMGMPEDQSSEIFKTLAGYGVWLCPNDHLYFVDECTATQESGTCPSCGAAIGQETEYCQQ